MEFFLSIVINLILFFLWWILKFLQPGGLGVRWEWENVFRTVTILFNQCNNTNITYQQFYSCLHWYLTQILNCYVTMFFPPPEKLDFGHLKCIFSHRFWHGWLKQTSFCRELDCLDRHLCSFCVFNLVPVLNFRSGSREKADFKIYIYIFQNFIQKLKKLGLWCPATSVCKWNKIKKNCAIFEIVGEDTFSAGPPKSLYFPSKSFSLDFTTKG